VSGTECVSEWNLEGLVATTPRAADVLSAGGAGSRTVCQLWCRREPLTGDLCLLPESPGLSAWHAHPQSLLSAAAAVLWGEAVDSSFVWSKSSATDRLGGLFF